MRAGAFLIVAAAFMLLFAVATASDSRSVKVIVYFKEPASDVRIKALGIQEISVSTAGNLGRMRAFSGPEMEIQRDLPALNGFIADVTPEYYGRLKLNPNVDVYPDAVLYTTLDSSANLINATKTWTLIYNLTNITGDGETVCVIDSGVNYSHINLGGCTPAQFLAGACDKVPSGSDFVNNDGDPMDGQSHGTHVAGIIASTNDTYRGIAPGARIIAIKACNDAQPTASCTVANVISGMDWCINNATRYNISVISMSLGAGSYTSWCDDDPDALSMVKPVNNATIRNITVVASTGNDGSSTSIGFPACIRNATAVGSTTKSDGFAPTGNRNSITDLVAPGDSITSLSNAGGVAIASKSGTSMATPHVSGAMVLLRQYFRVSQNITANATLLLGALNSTGRVLTDSGGSGLDYVRINPYAAILSQDTAGADFTFVAPTPADGATTTDNASIFINITASELVKNATLEWSNGTSNNYSMNGSGLNWHINFSTPVLGSVSYKVFANDSAGNIAYSETRTLSILPVISIYALSPSNALNVSGSMLVNASVNSSGEILRVNITLYNNTHNVTLPLLMNLSSGSLTAGYWNATLDSTAFPDGKYNVSVNASNVNGNTAISSNVSITIDNSFSNASIASNANFTFMNGSSAINASVNDSASGVFTVAFRIISQVTNSSWLQAAMNSGTIAAGYWNASFNFSTLPEGDYNITINTTDFAGNSRLVNISQVSVNGTFVAVISCSSLVESNKTHVLLNNVSSDGTCIEIAASNITLSCGSYSINYGITSSGYGIDVQSVNSTAIRNCLIIKNGTNNGNNYGIHLSQNTNATAIVNTTVITNGTRSNYGILLNSSRYTNISGSSITAGGNESYNFGIYLLADADYNNIASVTIVTNGASSNYGIFVEKSSNNVIARSSIFALGNVSNNYAILFNNASANNTLLLSNITANISDGSHGVYINNSNGNNITANAITAAMNGSQGILIENSNATVIASNIITTFGNFSFAVDVIGNSFGNSNNNSVYNNYFNTTARAVNVTGSAINNFSVAVASGTNIIGQSGIGGNYYDNSTLGGQQAFSLSCSDSDRNGICDSALEHAGNNTDFFPLRVPPPAPASPAGGSSSGSSSGGGGGGAASASASVSSSASQSRVWDLIEAGTQAEFKVTSEKIPVSSIKFELSEAAEDVELTVTKRLVKPDDVTDYPGVVNSYIGVTGDNLNSSLVSSATIAFSVEAAWIVSNSAVASDIVLARFSYGEWHDLPTALVSSTADYYNYSAFSPGLSVFAIALKPKPRIVQEKPSELVGNKVNGTLDLTTAGSGNAPAPAAAATKEPGEGKNGRSMYFFAAVLAVLLVVAAFFYCKKD